MLCMVRVVSRFWNEAFAKINTWLSSLKISSMTLSMVWYRAASGGVSCIPEHEDDMPSRGNDDKHEV